MSATQISFVDFALTEQALCTPSVTLPAAAVAAPCVAADYPHGTHSVLSPWHVKGRYMEPVKPSIGERLVAWLRGFFVKPAPLPRRVPVAAPSPAVARVVNRWTKFGDTDIPPPVDLGEFHALDEALKSAAAVYMSGRVDTMHLSRWGDWFYFAFEGQPVGHGGGECHG